MSEGPLLSAKDAAAYAFQQVDELKAAQDELLDVVTDLLSFLGFSPIEAQHPEVPDCVGRGFALLAKHRPEKSDG